MHSETIHSGVFMNHDWIFEKLLLVALSFQFEVACCAFRLKLASWYFLQMLCIFQHFVWWILRICRKFHERIFLCVFKLKSTLIFPFACWNRILQPNCLTNSKIAESFFLITIFLSKIWNHAMFGFSSLWMSLHVSPTILPVLLPQFAFWELFQ